MRAENGYSLIAEFAGSSDDGRKRREMLQLACKLSSSERACVALLWLYDPEKERLHLDHYEPLDDPQRELKRVSISFPRGSLEDRGAVGRATSEQPAVRSWADRTVPGAYRELFPISPRGAGGYLEILTANPLDEETFTLYRSFAEVIAGRITRHRDYRKLQVYAQLTTLQPDRIDVPDQGTQRWLAVAAEVARTATSAEVAVVFSESPNLSLRAMAWCPPSTPPGVQTAASHSLVQLAFEQKKPVRVLDHADVAERQALFERKGFDKDLTHALEIMTGKPLRSWIAAPVICDGEPLAVLLVVNKQPAEYLPEVFSGTDFQLIRHICDVVSRGLAQSRTNRAIRAISDFTFKHDVRFHTDPKSLGDQSELMSLVREHVPGVVAGIVSLRYRSDEPPGELWPLGELQPGLIDFLTQHVRRPFRKAVGPILGPPVPVSGVPHYLYEDALPFAVHQDRMAAVHLLTCRARLAKHHQDVLNYLNADIGQIVRSELMVRHHVEELTQIRHAIRSGLQGVRHIETAYAVYQQIVKKGMSPTDFRIAMLRKSLELTRLFADRCSNLMEESRFLLGRLRAEELRLAGTSIVKLVSETIAGLRPYAEDREIEIEFRNHIRGERQVVIDHQLMGIAIFNLIDNAIKYSHRNKPVKVSLDMTSRSWVLRVLDRGVYIHPEDQEAIFRPFVRRPTGQAQNTRPGTGLGLAVVGQILEAHKGRVFVNSVPLDSARPTDGADTTFTITVPG